MIIVDGTPTPQYLLVAQVPFLGTVAVHGHLVGKFLPIPHLPFGKHVVLDPDHFGQGADEGDLATGREVWMAHQGFDEDVLDIPETGADVNVFNVESVQPLLATMHHAIVLQSVTGLGNPRGLKYQRTRLYLDTARNPSWWGLDTVELGTSGETSCAV